MALLSSPRVAPYLPNTQGQLTTLTNAASTANRNVGKGPIDLMAIEVDNMYGLGTAPPDDNTKIWAKLYNDPTSAWAPGTSLPTMIFPVPQAIASADGVAGDGILIAYCLEGYPFDDGLSIAASQENGDTATAAPLQPANAELIFREYTGHANGPVASPFEDGLRIMELSGAKENLRLVMGALSNTPHDNIVTGYTYTIYRVMINASQNPGEDVSVRIYDATAATVGTTAAEILLPGRRGRQITWEFPRGIPLTDMSIACVKGQGATAGNVAPTGIVDVVVDLKLTAA